MAGDFNKCSRPQLSQSNTRLAKRGSMRLRHIVAMLRSLMAPIAVYEGCEFSMKSGGRLDSGTGIAASRQLTKAKFSYHFRNPSDPFHLNRNSSRVLLQ